MIRVDHLTVRYPRAATPALKKLSLTIQQGETVLLLGPSGGGKSTLALTLAGLIPQHLFAHVHGSVMVGGLDPLTAPAGEPAAQVGLLFQDPEAGFATLTVEDEIAFGLENLRVPPEAMPASILHALRQVGLAEFSHRRLDTLSGGEAQRVALAALLAMDPPILVLDEPTSNLDPAATRRFFETLAELRDGRTILLIEHKLDACLHLADRLILLNSDGTLLAEGKPQAVFEQHLQAIMAAGIWVPQELEASLGARDEPAGRRAAATRRAGLLPRRGTPRPRLVSGPGTHTGTEPDLQSEVGELRGDAGVEVDSSTSGPIRAVNSDFADPPAVLVRDLFFAYDGRPPVLQGVDLSIRQNDFLALLGPNGSGKTTLALQLMGLLPPPSQGEIHLFGDPVRELPLFELTERAGYVFQNPEHQFVADTVWDELAFSLRARRWPKDSVQARVESLLDRFRLRDQARQNPFTLSQGQKRRLSVATMLAVGQRLLILDEPTFGQDRLTAQSLMEDLVELNRQGVVILMITHDMRLVRRYAHRAAVLLEGRIALEGTPDHLFSQPELLDAAQLR